MSNNKLLQRKYHPSASLIEDFSAGDLVCPQCGLVVGERIIDMTNEWRTFAGDGTNPDGSRVGAIDDGTNNDAVASTIIQESKDSKHLNAKGNKKYRNQEKVSAATRMIRQCHNHISQLADRLTTNEQIQKKALAYVKEIAPHKEMRTLDNEAVACACLYLAFKQESIARTIKEIHAVSNVELKKINKASKKVSQKLDLQLNVCSASDYLTRFSYLMKFKNKFTEALSKEIADNLTKTTEFSSKSPLSVSAVSLYIASCLMDEGKTKTDIAGVVSVAEGTVSAFYKIAYTLRSSWWAQKWSQNGFYR